MSQEQQLSVRHYIRQLLIQSNFIVSYLDGRDIAQLDNVEIEVIKNSIAVVKLESDKALELIEQWPFSQ